MIGRSPRPRLHPGRHRKLPVVTESTLPPNVAASLPLHSTAPRPSLPPVPARPEPDVRCGWCGAIGPSSLIPEVPTRGPRCADYDACNARWAAGRPVSLVPHGAGALEPLPVAEPEPPVVLPPAQEAAMAAFEAAHDEEDATEGEPLSKDEVTPEAAAEADIAPGPPVSDQGVTETAEPAPVAADDAAEAAETPDGGKGE